jgi:hypothetical protein
MIFMDNVERDDQKRNSQKAAAAGVTAAAVIIPTAVPVVLLGIIYFVALVANTRL